MKILCVETATKACSVALLNETKSLDRFEVEPRQHTRLLLPMIDELLNAESLKITDLTAFAISIGPGSFSGLRIGAGIIQAMSFASSRPVALISSLQILAQTICDEENIDKVAVFEDAHMGEIYVGLYQKDKEGLMQQISIDRLLAPDDLPQLTGDWCVTGSALSIYQDAIEKSVENISASKNEAYPKAKSMIKLAVKQINAGDIVAAADVVPVYLRTTDAWRK